MSANPVVVKVGVESATARKVLRGTLWMALVMEMGLFGGVACAQDQAASAPAKTATASPNVGAYGDWFVRAGLTCGSGASSSQVATKPTVQCGAVAGVGSFFDLEAGVMGPQASRSAASGYLSTNFWMPLIPFKRLGSKHGVPLVVGGYTRMFETGHALDYGLAFARPIDRSHSVQFEVRDYWIFANPSQHNVVFRVVWLVGVPD